MSRAHPSDRAGGPSGLSHYSVSQPDGAHPLRKAGRIIRREKWIPSYQAHLAFCFLRDEGLDADFADFLNRVAAVENADD